jgi:hypothetical protein
VPEDTDGVARVRLKFLGDIENRIREHALAGLGGGRYSSSPA